MLWPLYVAGVRCVTSMARSACRDTGRRALKRRQPCSRVSGL